MIEDLTKHPDFPRILLAESKEKFRRRSNIALVSGIFILLLVMIWAGYQNYSFHKTVGTNYCYACGYYEGKSCTTAYFPADVRNDPLAMERLRKELATKNAEVNPVNSVTDPFQKDVNLSKFNFSS